MIIFLDVDGVLNQLQGNYYLDNRCIKQLSRLCKKLDAKIVLSSSWRMGYVNFGKCSPQIEALKEQFEKYGIELIGRTKNLGSRYKEIRTYIEEYGIENYIVLDDDRSEFEEGMLPNTYFTNSNYGLTQKDVSQILRIVNTFL